MAEMTAKFDPLPPLCPKASNNNLKNPSAGEMDAFPNPKKKAKFDRTSVKYILDQTAIEIVEKRFMEDRSRRRERGYKLVGGALLIGIGVFAQFYPEKFPFQIPDKKQSFFCFMHYYFGILQLFRSLMVRHVFMFAYPSAAKSRCTSGLALSSKLSRSSDLYTLTVASAKATSSWENPPVKLTKSFSEWFASDGVLLEDLYSKDVEGLVSEYVKDSNKRGMWCSLRLSLIHWFWKSFLMLALLKLVEAMVQ